MPILLGSAMPFLAARAATVVPLRAAIAESVSPALTVYPVDAGAGVERTGEADDDEWLAVGIEIVCPMLMRFGFDMPFAAARVATVVPSRAAMAESVSPLATV